MIKISSKLYLMIFSVFLILGNAPRILPIPASFGAANIGELVLYISAILYFLTIALTGGLKRGNSFGYIFIAATFFSLAIGLFKWGPQASAIAYNFRLVMQLLSAIAAGLSLFLVYGFRADLISLQTIRLYAFCSILALLLFIAFPESTVLWAALGDVGIDFEGDPHIGRLVSLYFDPNYFGTIIVFPLLLISIPKTSKIFLFSCAVLFIVCLALTASRSGISTFLLLIGYITLIFCAKVAIKKNINRTLFFQALAAIGFMTAVAFFNIDYIDSVLDRFTDVSTDESAGARIDSFKIGNTLIEQEPFFGYGYNYGLEAGKRYRSLPIDSSIQVIIVNFGFFGFFTLLLCFLIWTFRMNGYLRTPSLPPAIKNLWRISYLYFLCCLLWAGNFNQLVFYPFWLIPVVAMFSYLEIALRNCNSISNQNSEQLLSTRDLS